MENLDQFNVGQKENLDITTEVIGNQQLIDIVYQGNILPQDKRFFSKEDGGVFEYLDLRNLGYHQKDKFYPIVKEGKKIVCLSELVKDPFNKNNLWIQFISTDPNEQNKGYASKIIKEIFDFAQENNFSLEASHYTDTGFEKLRPVFERLSREYPVKFINKGKL